MARLSKNCAFKFAEHWQLQEMTSELMYQVKWAIACAKDSWIN